MNDKLRNGMVAVDINCNQIVTESLLIFDEDCIDNSSRVKGKKEVDYFVNNCFHLYSLPS